MRERGVWEESFRSGYSEERRDEGRRCLGDEASQREPLSSASVSVH